MEVRRMNEKNSKNKKGMSMKGQRTLAYIVLIIISFFCLFWFYVLFINATRSNGALKKGFTAIPGGHLIENWKNLLAGTLPVWNGMFNSIFIATCSAVLCTYFSTMTAYAIHAYNFKAKKFTPFRYKYYTCNIYQSSSYSKRQNTATKSHVLPYV